MKYNAIIDEPRLRLLAIVNTLVSWVFAKGKNVEFEGGSSSTTLFTFYSGICTSIGDTNIIKISIRTVV